MPEHKKVDRRYDMVSYSELSAPRKYLVPRRYYVGLYEIAKAVSSSLQICDVLNAIVEKTARAVDVKACSLILLSPDKTRLWYGSSYGLSESYIQKGPIFNKAAVGQCCAECRPIPVLKASEDSLIQYPEAAKTEGITSFLFLPLCLRDEIIGILTVYTSDPRTFPVEEVNFLEAIASLAAQALSNARLYEWVGRNKINLASDLLGWCNSWAIQEKGQRGKGRKK
jgi:GAF domain-containing protein